MDRGGVLRILAKGEAARRVGSEQGGALTLLWVGFSHSRSAPLSGHHAAHVTRFRRSSATTMPSELGPSARALAPALTDASAERPSLIML